MSDLIKTIKNIQRTVGVELDGIFGLVTASAVMRTLNGIMGIEEKPEAHAEAWMSGLDERTISNITTLDPKCREKFAEFALLANATAATFGCSYVMIGGDRSWKGQDELYAQGRTKPGAKVTNARGGYSNHNFAIAGDFGVFRGKAYLDNTEPATAAKIHKAVSQHAAACGLQWGGSWSGFKDLPHYEVETGLSMAAKRKLMKEKGSVL